MNSSVKLKVCGMRNSGNIAALAELQPDYIGFIFYPESKRYANDLDVKTLNALPSQIKKTGVFVNATEENIRAIVERYNLQAVQLHGNETPELCLKLKASGLEIIKAFGVDNDFDFKTLDDYKNTADYFLFDTKTTSHGGSGKLFDWNLLKSYHLDTPYFLSGGLSIENITDIQNIKDERLFALDLNSRFETEPGVKNIELLKTFFTKFKTL